MQAIVISSPGGPDVLRWADVDDPRPGPGEVLVGVAASAVNRADVAQREGHYRPPPGAPPYLGLECSGRVVEAGADAGEWTVGTEVCALLAGGGYAEQVAVPVGQLLPVPRGVDLYDAAALPEVVCTVWSNVFGYGRLRAGETLLVHGGASGVGTMAIQLAKAFGARVVCTASAAKHEQCRRLGADVTIDYRTEDFVERTREATDGRGADVILDNMGAEYLGRNLDAVAMDGRIAVIGFQGGRVGQLDLGRLFARRATLHSASLRGRPPEQKAAIVREVREHVWPLVESGAVRPVVDRRLPMAEAAEAHRLLESSGHVGKLLLVN